MRKSDMSDTVTVLVIRTCGPDMTSYGGFRWPQSGPVEAPDWEPDPIVGCGLHGLLWGTGDGDLLNWSPESKWLVVEVDADVIVDLGDNVKFPRGTVVHCGDRVTAMQYLVKRIVDPARVVTTTVGDGGITVAGKNVIAIAGCNGIATAGKYGTAVAGHGGVAMVGHGGIATAGYEGAVIVHYWDERARRMRLAVGYTGEDGLEPCRYYRVEGGKLVPADDEAPDKEG